MAGDLSLEFALCLVDLERGTTLQPSESQTAHYGQTRWRFSLGEFKDTLRHSEDTPLLEFQLEIADYQANALRQVPVLHLTRRLGIRAVSIEHRDEMTLSALGGITPPAQSARSHLGRVAALEPSA